MAQEEDDPLHVEAVLGSLRTAERHVDSEYIDDHDETLNSVSREPCYGMMSEPGVVKVVNDSAGVAQFYEDARAAFLPGASRIVAQIATDWYVFLENVPTRLNAQTGVPRSLHTATLFPKAPDGIRGEFLWERSTGEAQNTKPLEGQSGALPLGGVRNLSIHEELLGKLCAGNLSGIVSMYDEKCICAVRDYVTDGRPRSMLKLQGEADVEGAYGRWLSEFTLERVSVLNRLVTDWYVFAEELLIVRRRGSDARLQYRKASIYPITPDGKIQGEIGFGTDIALASPSSGQTLGAAFYVREDPAKPSDPTLVRRSKYER